MSELKISPKEIQHISKLARLQITEQEAINYSEQLSKAIGYFEQISAVETQGIEPLVTPTDIQQNLRADVVVKENSSDEILQNAPQKTGRLFTVPPVV